MKTKHFELLPREAACGRLSPNLEMVDDLELVTCKQCRAWLGTDDDGDEVTAQRGREE